MLNQCSKDFSIDKAAYDRAINSSEQATNNTADIETEPSEIKFTELAKTTQWWNAILDYNEDSEVEYINSPHPLHPERYYYKQS